MGRDSATHPSPRRCARPLAKFRQFAVLAVSWTVTHAPSVASHKLNKLHEMPSQSSDWTARQCWWWVSSIYGETVGHGQFLWLQNGAN